MAKEAQAQRCPAGIGRRVAGSDKLNPIERDPSLVSGSPEAILLHKLSEKRDGAWGAVLVGSRKIDLVAEDNKPPANLRWLKNDSVESFTILAVLFEGLDEKAGCCGT